MKRKLEYKQGPYFIIEAFDNGTINLACSKNVTEKINIFQVQPVIILMVFSPSSTSSISFLLILSLCFCLFVYLYKLGKFFSQPWLKPIVSSSSDFLVYLKTSKFCYVKISWCILGQDWFYWLELKLFYVLSFKPLIFFGKILIEILVPFLDNRDSIQQINSISHITQHSS